MITLNLEQIVRKVGNLPSLDQALNSLIRSLRDEDANVAAIAAQIKRDQALTARILRVANSAFYGHSGKVGTITEATVMLGFGTVRTLALAGGIIGRFPAGTGPAFDRLAFWQHSIGTAVCASVLAAATGRNADQAFTAGLLHVVGRLVLDVYFPDEFRAVVTHHDQAGCTFLEAERTVLKLDDAGIGGEMARLWRLPDPIQEAIRNYPRPPAAVSATLADIVHVADVLCHALEIGNAGDKWVPLLDHGAWERLGIGWDGIQRIFARIDEQNAGLNLLLHEA